MVDLPTDITITAQYSEGDVNESAEKDVSIFAICPSGSALDFDGQNDYVSLSGNAVTTTEFTICAWANHYGPGGGSDGINPIFQQRDNSIGDNRGAIIFYSENTEGKAVAYIRSSNGSIQKLTGCPRKDYNQWHYYALTVGSNKLAYYVDAVEVDSAANNQVGDYVTSIDFVDIGRHKYSQVDKGFFNGLIDEVAIYNRALSAEEIRELMHTRPDTDDPSLVAYWDFDEGEGQFTGDSAGGNNGRLGSTGGIDDSGPNWVDSVPPVGICTNRQLMERDFSDVFEIKLNILEQLEKALSKERAIEYLLGECIASGELGDIKKNDLVKAEHDLSTAVRKENRAKTSVDESIDDLDDALATLNIELPVED
jgi:hypothetical protein